MDQELFELGKVYVSHLDIDKRLKEEGNEEQREKIMGSCWVSFWAAVEEAGYTKEQFEAFAKENDLELQMSEMEEDLVSDKTADCLHYVNAQILEDVGIKHLFPHLRDRFLEISEGADCKFQQDCDNPLECSNFTHCPDDIQKKFLHNIDGGAWQSDMNKEKWDRLHPGDSHPLDK